jgi:hypothetical protein
MYCANLKLLHLPVRTEIVLLSGVSEKASPRTSSITLAMSASKEDCAEAYLAIP